MERNCVECGGGGCECYKVYRRILYFCNCKYAVDEFRHKAQALGPFDNEYNILLHKCICLVYMVLRRVWEQILLIVLAIPLCMKLLQISLDKCMARCSTFLSGFCVHSVL